MRYLFVAAYALVLSIAESDGVIDSPSDDASPDVAALVSGLSEEKLHEVIDSLTEENEEANKEYIIAGRLPESFLESSRGAVDMINPFRPNEDIVTIVGRASQAVSPAPQPHLIPAPMHPPHHHERRPEGFVEVHWLKKKPVVTPRQPLPETPRQSVVESPRNRDHAAFNDQRAATYRRPDTRLPGNTYNEYRRSHPKDGEVKRNGLSLYN